MSDFNEEKVVDVNFDKMQKKVQKIVPAVIVVLLLVVGFLSSFYTLESGENGVILRIGEYNKTVKQAGLHMKIPFIDIVEKVNVDIIQNMEYGFSTNTPGTESREASYDNILDQAKVIVDGDNDNASIALIELVINYKVSDPRAYLFNVSDREGTLRLALEDSVRSSVQALTIDEAKVNKELINETTMKTLQKKMNDYEAGIEIVSVKTQNVNFLDAVEAVFQKKESANQYKKAREEDAEKYSNTEIPLANAEASKILSEAEIYQVQTVVAAKAGVAEFNALYKEYLINPDIVKEKYYVEAMTEFILNNKVIVDVSDNGNVFKFYNMDENNDQKLSDNIKKEVVIESKGGEVND